MVTYTLMIARNLWASAALVSGVELPCGEAAEKCEYLPSRRFSVILGKSLTLFFAGFLPEKNYNQSAL